jgi:hypothetical protein
MLKKIIDELLVLIAYTRYYCTSKNYNLLYIIKKIQKKENIVLYKSNIILLIEKKRIDKKISYYPYCNISLFL